MLDLLFIRIIKNFEKMYYSIVFVILAFFSTVTVAMEMQKLTKNLYAYSEHVLKTPIIERMAGSKILPRSYWKCIQQLDNALKPDPATKKPTILFDRACHTIADFLLTEQGRYTFLHNPSWCNNLLLPVIQTRVKQIIQDKITQFRNTCFTKVTVVEAHSTLIVWLEFDKSGKLVLSVSDKGDVKVWNVYTKKIVAIFKFEASVACARFSPDASMIAAACDKRIMLLTVKNEELKSLKTFTDVIKYIEFDPTGNKVAFIFNKSPNIGIYDVQTNKISLIKDSHFVENIAFSKAGKLIAIAAGDKVNISVVSDGRLAATFQLPNVRFVLFGKDSKYIICISCENGRSGFSCIQSATRELLCRFELDTMITWLGGNALGDRVYLLARDKKFAIWDFENGFTWFKKRNKINHIAFNDDLTMCLTACGKIVNIAIDSKMFLPFAKILFMAYVDQCIAQNTILDLTYLSNSKVVSLFQELPNELKYRIRNYIQLIE